MDTIGEMKITRDNGVYKSFKELQELKEKNIVAWGIFENGQRIFKQLKRSEFKNENPLTFLRRLKELYSSEKKSKE